MKPAEPVILVVIGITGDLSKRMLLPALYHLEQDGLLPDECSILGTTRGDLEKDQLRADMQNFIESCEDGCDEVALDTFMERISIIEADASTEAGAQTINETLVTFESDGRCLRRLFYLAVPPKVLDEVVRALGSTQADQCGHGSAGRILIEKPFGHDQQSAQALSELLNQYYQEDQIYRIDHYLAKDTVQNILHFRSRNPLVKDIWSSQYIDHIQISVLESIDIQGRVNFFEQTGILRDMVQSHLLQLVAVTAMDEPAELTSDAIRQGREQILQKVTPPTPTDVVRAQYAGYKDEVSNQQSNTETYTAMKFYIDSERWRDVPVYLRTGKALADKVTEIVLVYSDDQAHTNILTLRIKPNEGFALTISAKKPGLTNQQEEIIMDYCYDTNSGNSIKHDAYEKLLIDAMNGDQTLFPTTTEIMESWRFVDAIIANWSEDDKPPVSYDKASTGPAEANDLMAEEATGWVDERRNICTPRFKPPNSQ